MKKVITLTAAVLFIGGLLLTSCNSNKTLCPAYPPPTYQGDVDSDELPAQVITIEEQNNL